MKSRTTLLACCLVTLTAFGAQAAPRIGQSVEDFVLRSHRGRQWSLSEFSEKKIVVVAFLGTECPLAKLYGPRLAELHEQFAEKGVAFIGINANTQDTMTELTAYADRYKISFPLLKDASNRVADAMEAKRTPEVFVLDRDRKIRYHGRIDDQYGVGFARENAVRQDLLMAIQQLLAGEEVTVPETEVIGCHIGRVSNVEPTGEVTYAKHIARIFSKRCVECHREDEIAPFPLATYDDVVGWGDTIAEVISDNRMPPWFANPEHGKFRNDARLTNEEKVLVFRWIENGMPEGDPSALPPPRQFVKG